MLEMLLLEGIPDQQVPVQRRSGAGMTGSRAARIHVSLRPKKIMTEKKRSWTKIAETVEAIDFSSNQIAELMAGDKKICVAKQNDGLFAFAHKCPHAGGFFIDGFVDPLGNVVCPLHRYKYCLKNGRNVSGEGYYLKHWPVEVREDGVYVSLDTNSLFGWL